MDSAGIEPVQQRRWHHRHVQGGQRIIRNFAPSWFSVNMGTGIVSILLYNLPYNAIWIYWLSVIIFALNVLLFILFLALTILRSILYPEIMGQMIRHPTQSVFLGTFPMGLATIISMIAFVCVPAWGNWASLLAWGLWWFDAAISFMICYYVLFTIMYIHETNLQSITATWLLPVVSTIVASATGGVVAETLSNKQHALWTIIVSYILWGTGIPLALSVLVILFQRLAVHKLPPRDAIVPLFIPLGPLGQGGFAIQQLGKVAMDVFPLTQSIPGRADAGSVLYVLGWAIALILWAYGIAWMFFAVASISRGRFPFNIGWWNFTFPLGVFALSTITLAKETPSAFFRVLGTIFSLVVVLLWIVVSLLTIRDAYSGAIFFAPRSKDLEREHEPGRTEEGQDEGRMS